jgi:FHS family L-fucose permease-like MFS transporter
MSVPSGRIVAAFGYQRGIVLGLLTAGCGALLFYPSASVLSYPLFLAALFVLASGITLLQVAANPYVAVLGKPETASSRLTLTQAFNSLGTTLAPYLGGLFILTAGMPAGDVMTPLSPELLQAFHLQEAASVKTPYLGLAAALIGFAVVMAFLKLPVIASAEGHDLKPASLFDALRHSHVFLGGLAIFCYVGAEVSISSFLINFLGQPDIAGLDPTAAARFVAYYWGGAMIGRFIGSALLQNIEAGKLLGLFAAIAGGLVVTTSLTDGMVAMWAIVSIGLFNSIMFPTIFTLAISGLGHLTSQGASILVMSIIGGAIIPLLSGVLADRYGIQMALLLSAACYLYILYFSLAGSRSV